jgi:hypothetical protein
MSQKERLHGIAPGRDRARIDQRDPGDRESSKFAEGAQFGLFANFHFSCYEKRTSVAPLAEAHSSVQPARTCS